MILIAFATSFFATTAGIYFLVPFTHKLGLTDSPDIRKNHVGVTAGASTPSWVIDKVVERIQEFDAKCN